MNTYAVSTTLLAAIIIAPAASTRPQDVRWSLRSGSVVYESHGADRVNIHRYDAGTSGPVALTSHRARDLRHPDLFLPSAR